MLRLPFLSSLFSLTAILLLPASAQDAPAAKQEKTSTAQLVENFEKVPEKPVYVVRNQITHSPRRPSSAFDPKVEKGQLVLCPGSGGAHSSVAWPRLVEGRHRRVEAHFSFRLGGGAQGLSYALLATSRFGAEGPAFQLYRAKGLPGRKASYPDWDEPNLWGSLAVAFDGENPPTDDPFDERGNVHGQPQHEVSLHWDGRELRNRQSPVDFTKGEPVKARVLVDFVSGGAELTVELNGVKVYEREFLPHVFPYESRIGFGARGENRGAIASLDDVAVQWQLACERFPAPMLQRTFRSEWMGIQKHSTVTGTFELPDNRPYERILMSIHLKPLVKRDEWDRLGHVSLIDKEGRIWELARLLTPFMLWGAEYRWDVDVTHFRHLLQGKVQLSASGGGNVGDGFALDLDFHYYKRPKGVAPLPELLGLGYLWNQAVSFRKGKRDSWPKPVTLTPPAQTQRVVVNCCVTGHGVQEFRPSPRILKVQDKAYENTLWTTDCYLNPYRPQYGTWKYNRAGWGPGSIGRTWRVDVSEQWAARAPLRFEYIPEDKTFDKWASHQLVAYAIYYAE